MVRIGVVGVVVMTWRGVVVGTIVMIGAWGGMGMGMGMHTMFF